MLAASSIAVAPAINSWCAGTRSPCAEQTASPSSPLAVCAGGAVVTVSDQASPSTVDNLCQQGTECVQMATDIIYSLLERASDSDVFGGERSEAVTACTPRKALGP